MQLTCVICEGDAGTSLVCGACRPYLKPGQKDRLRAAWHKAIVTAANCACVECGHSAPWESGELCGDHILTQGSRPDLVFDLTNGRCVCLPCHNRRHANGLPKKSADGTKPKKVLRLPICKAPGCPVYATGTGGRPERCWKHQ